MENLTPQDMDNNADIAAAELSEIAIDKAEEIAIVADWMKKHFMKAGYKRLCRILVKEYSSNKSIEGIEEDGLH